MSNNNSQKAEEYDLDYKTDKFWAENLNQPFPDACNNVDNALNLWKVEYDALGHKKESTKVKMGCLRIILTY